MSCLNKFLALALAITFNFGAIKLSGNGESETFTVPVGPYTVFPGSSKINFKLYVGAAEEKEGNDYAVAYAQAGGRKFSPLFSEQVIVRQCRYLCSQGDGNKQTEVTEKKEKLDNPLVGKAIAYLGLVGSDPAIVTIKDGLAENFIYLFIDSASCPTLKTSSKLNDSNGLISKTIKNVLSFNSGIVAAVTPNDDPSYGAPGSGLSLVKNTVESVRKQNNRCSNKNCNQNCDFCKKNCEISNFDIFAATNADPNSKEKMNKAAPLDVTSSAVKIGSDLTSLTPTTSFLYDTLSLGYMGFAAQGGADATDGVRGLVRIKSSNNKLYINPIAPTSVFATENGVVGGLGASLNLNIKFVGSLVTSTLLTYIVVLSEINGEYYFYALPVVGADKDKGALASLNALPKERFTDRDFNGRYFYKPATDPADFNIDEHPELIVGGASDLPTTLDNVSSVTVSGDAVLISVKDGDTTGVFSTQALFDENGVISGWTNWSRSTGGSNPVSSVIVDDYTSTVWTIQNNAYDVYRTAWGYGTGDGILGGTDDTNGYIQLNNDFLQKGGVQGINEFINGSLVDMSWTVTTGLDKVIVARTGTGSGDFPTPVVGNYKSCSVFSNNGSWPAAQVDTKLVGISGGDLEKIGPVVTSSVYTNSDNESWLVVAGFGGLAVMAQDDGHGWVAIDSLVFSGSFKKINSQEQILKLFSDSGWLYILSTYRFERVKLTADSILNGVFSDQEVLATTDSLKALLTDFVLTGDKLYLGTSRYLMYYDGGWNKVVTPGVSLPIVSLNLLSGSDIDQLYVLSGYQGYNESYLNRFCIKKDDIVPLPLPDKFTKNSDAPFLNFGSFIDYFYTDGFRRLRMQALNGITEAILAQVKNNGKPFSGIRSVRLPFSPTANMVDRGVTLKSVGSFLINGSFGLWTEE